MDLKLGIEDMAAFITAMIVGNMWQKSLRATISMPVRSRSFQHLSMASSMNGLRSRVETRPISKNFWKQSRQSEPLFTMLRREES